MLKYIDKNGKKKPLIEYSNLCIEEVLDYGDKTLTCNVSVKCSVALEDIIRTRTDEYVIKQKNGPADDGTYTVTAKLNIDELEGTPFISFDTTEKTALEASQLALAGTGWTCECDVKKKRTIRMTNASSWEILKKIVDTYMLEMQIDSINKVIRLKGKIGSYKGAYFTDQINLISLESQANTNDFYTRIYPIGKDGLTIESVNNGSTILENHIYSSKNKTYIWKDERYTDPQSLKEDAAEKLADMAQPYIAYSCSILDLSKNSKKYKNYNIGDEVVLIDSFSKTKIKQRIKKISRYPDDPSKDTCEIANLKLTFTEMQQKLNDAADTVNNITTDNGTVDGSSIDDMDANKLTNVDDVVSKTESFKSIKAEVLTVTGELQSASGKIGELETNKLDSETARITYATIANLKSLSGEFEQFKTNDFTAITGKVNDLTVGVEKVNTLMFGSATGESITTDFANSVVSLIGDAQIKDAMIANISASKITSGAIYTNLVKIYGDNSKKLCIEDNTIQMSDDNDIVRMQMGEDSQGRYNIIIRNSDEEVIFDAVGVTEKGYHDGSIKNIAVADNANIGAEKLNIDSLFNVINNDGTHTLKSNKIYLDDASQTLNVLLQDIKTSSGKDYNQWGSLLKQSDDFITQKLWWTENIDGTSVKEKFSNVNQTLQEYSVRLSNLAKYDDEIYLISYEPTKDNYPAWDWGVPVYPSDTQFPREETWQYNDTEWDKYIGKVAYWESEGRAWRFIRNEDGSHGWKDIPNSETAYMLKQNSALRINLDSISSSLTLTQQDLKDKYSTTTQMNNAITQAITKESNSIKLEVSNTYATNEALKSYATNASLELKVSKKDLISSINASADVISIKADRLEIQSQNASWSKEGIVSFIAGTIGEWNITKIGLNKTSTEGTVSLYAPNTEQSTIIGVTSKVSGYNELIPTFILQDSGKVSCTQINIHDIEKNREINMAYGVLNIKYLDSHAEIGATGVSFWQGNDMASGFKADYGVDRFTTEGYGKIGGNLSIGGVTNCNSDLYVKGSLILNNYTLPTMKGFSNTIIQLLGGDGGGLQIFLPDGTTGVITFDALFS